MKLAPRMIELAKLDLGETWGELGIACDAPKKEKHYPTLYISGKDEAIEIPDSGTATVQYVVRGRSMNQRDGKKKHSADIEIRTIDPVEDETKEKPLPGAAKMLSALRPGMIEFSDRSRNNDGQFVANETGGADPTSMAAAYGPQAIQRTAGMGLVSGAAAGVGGAVAGNILTPAIKRGIKAGARRLQSMRA